MKDIKVLQTFLISGGIGEEQPLKLMNLQTLKRPSSCNASKMAGFRISLSLDILFVNPREAVEMMDVGLHDLMAFLTSSTFVKFP